MSGRRSPAARGACTVPAFTALHLYCVCVLWVSVCTLRLSTLFVCRRELPSIVHVLYDPVLVVMCTVMWV